MKTIYKSQKEFYDLKWLLKAKSKGTIKPIFCKMLIESDGEDKILVCTDSRRLHFLKDEQGFFADCPDGIYDIIKSDAKEIVIKLNEEFTKEQYPDYRQVIPQDKYLTTLTILNNDIKTRDISPSRAIAETYFSFYQNFPGCELCFNIDLFQDAMIENEFSVKVCGKDGNYNSNAPIVFEAENKKGIFIPIYSSIRSRLNKKEE